MRVGREPVGRWGITLLAVTGIAGLLLAWVGGAGWCCAPVAGRASHIQRARSGFAVLGGPRAILGCGQPGAGSLRRRGQGGATT